MMHRRSLEISAKNRGKVPATSVAGNTALQTDKTLELVCALHASLDIKAIIEQFAQVVCKETQCQAIHYEHQDLTLDVEIGKTARHKFSYNLTTGNDNLGSLTFSSSKRFEDAEITTLENMLCILVAPLKNALEHKQAMQLALIDPLTSVANRAALIPALRRDLELAKRYDHSLAILALDIDHFKRINDSYGHGGGDEYLQAFADYLQQTVRDSDLVFRMGGEEFIVILSKTDTIGAINLAERIRKGIAHNEVLYNDQTIQTTVSIGVSTYTPGDSSNSLLEKADQAMYRAKNDGRNKVSV